MSRPIVGTIDVAAASRTARPRSPPVQRAAAERQRCELWRTRLLDVDRVRAASALRSSMPRSAAVSGASDPPRLADQRSPKRSRAVGGVDDRLVWIFFAILAHGALDLLGRACGSGFSQPRVLPRGEVLPALRGVERCRRAGTTSSGCRSRRRSARAVGSARIASCTSFVALRPTIASLAGLPLPLGDRVEPELHEVQRAGELGAGQVDDVGVAGEVVEALADVRAVQLAARRSASRRRTARPGRSACRRRTAAARGSRCR